MNNFNHMKRALLYLSALLIITSAGFGENRYVTKVIYPDGSIYYDLNNKGEVAFIGIDGSGQHQVYLYSHGVLKKISDSYSYSYSYYSIDLNNNGQIVWTMYSAEGTSTSKNMVMLWNGKNVVKIQDNIYWNQVVSPKMNDDTVIVWNAAPGYGVHHEIYRYRNGKVDNVSNSWYNPDYNPQISEEGQIVWYGDNRNQNQWYNRIRYIRPGETEVAEIPDESSDFPKIGGNTCIIYKKTLQSTTALKLFDGSQITEIDDSIHTEGSTSYHMNNGRIVYSKLNSSKKFDIIRYSNNAYTLLSIPGADNYHAKVNKNGMTVWSDSNSEIYVNREGEISKIGSGHLGVHPLISDEGLMVWAGGSIGNYYNEIFISEYKNVFDVSGKIELQNGDPLQGATVYLNGDTAGETAADGTFIISDIDPGEISLTFSKTGYSFEPDTVTGSLSGHWQISPDIVARQTTFADNDLLVEKIRVYPNPVTGKLYLSIPTTAYQDGRLELIGTDGSVKFSRILDELHSNSEIDVDLPDCSPGLYFIRLAFSGKTETYPLIIK